MLQKYHLQDKYEALASLADELKGKTVEWSPQMCMDQGVLMFLRKAHS
jgi:hypothetical protein